MSMTLTIQDDFKKLFLSWAKAARLTNDDWLYLLVLAGEFKFKKRFNEI